MAEPRLEDVFKISGVPTHTFVEPSVFPALKVSLRSAGRGLIVEGPSGIGKSTAVTQALADLGISDHAQPLSARRKEDVEYIGALADIEDFGVVIVDDFHVLPDRVKRQIADLLKTLADAESERSKLVIIGINRAGESLVRHAPDLANRIDTIRFEAEPNLKVIELVRRGEDALNVGIEAREEVVEAAGGSFYLAQLLAHELCLEADVLERREESYTVSTLYPVVRRKVMERQGRRFEGPTKEFVRGPRFRPGGRAPYLHILMWLAESRTWAIDLQEEMKLHPNEKASVGQVVDKGYLASLTGNHDIAAIMHFDQATKIMSIEDPHFIFYLRNLDWPAFAREVGFTRVTFDQPYDFALSFAGEDRAFAEKVADHLEAAGHAVFYDFNEQHRILARDIETFLAPIYESKAAMVIAILGPKYGEKRWTRFESDRFKHRIEAGEVIPVWSRDAPPTAFDQTADIGGLFFDPHGDVDEQARRVAEMCSRRLAEAQQAGEQASLLDTGAAS